MTNLKTLTRDISLTLIVKLGLLFLLWWVCFKDHPKAIPVEQHLLAPTQSPLSMEKSYDSRQ